MTKWKDSPSPRCNAPCEKTHTHSTCHYLCEVVGKTEVNEGSVCCLGPHSYHDRPGLSCGQTQSPSGQSVACHVSDALWHPPGCLEPCAPSTPPSGSAITITVKLACSCRTWTIFLRRPYSSQGAAVTLCNPLCPPRPAARFQQHRRWAGRIIQLPSFWVSQVFLLPKYQAPIFILLLLFRFLRVPLFSMG